MQNLYWPIIYGYSDQIAFMRSCRCRLLFVLLTRKCFFWQIVSRIPVRISCILMWYVFSATVAIFQFSPCFGDYSYLKSLYYNRDVGILNFIWGYTYMCPIILETSFFSILFKIFFFLSNVFLLPEDAVSLRLKIA